MFRSEGIGSDRVDDVGMTPRVLRRLVGRGWNQWDRLKTGQSQLWTSRDEEEECKRMAIKKRNIRTSAVSWPQNGQPHGVAER